jgi:NYN domain-containing protein
MVGEGDAVQRLPPEGFMPTTPPVYIFWDNSNIFVSAKKYVATRHDGPLAEQQLRIQFDNLERLAQAGRPLRRAVCTGSVPPELGNVWTRLRNTGVLVQLFERGKDSGKEQGVDQCLQVHMLRALADESEPCVAVMLTGDGAGYDTGAGYHKDLERMAAKGWGIEVISWDVACNKRLKSWAQQVGVYIPLEDYYASVTFLESGRRSSILSLKNRPLAVPQRIKS